MDERLRLIAEMKDRLSPGLRRLKTIMESTGRVSAFQKLARDMSLAERTGYRLAFTLGRTVKWGAIGAAGGIGIAGAAFVKFGKQSADALDDQAAFAKQINWSADSLRTLQGVAKRYNVDQEQMRGGLQKFTTLFGRLKQGQGGFFTYLKKTNPALLEQFRHTKSGQEAFLLLSDAISKTADPAKRAALAKAAGLGQQFLRFFADGPEDLRKTIREVDRLQGRLGPKAFQDAADYGDAMDNIGLAWEGLRDKLTVAALPIVNPLLADLANFMAENREGITGGFKEIATDVGAGLRAFGAWAGELKASDFRSFWEELKTGAAAVRDIAGSIVDLVAAIRDMGGWKAVLGAIIAYKAVGGIGGLGGMLGGLLSGGATAGAAASGGGGLMGALAPLGAVLGLYTALTKLDPGGNLFGLTSGIDAWFKDRFGIDPSKIDASGNRGTFGQRFLGQPNPPNAWDRPSPSATPPLSSPFNRSNLPPDVLKRAADAANAFRADPEGARGRMRVQLGRADLQAAAAVLVKLQAQIEELQKRGLDKQFAKEFAEIVAQRDTVAAYVLRMRAAEIGEKIGGSAADSLLDRMRGFFKGLLQATSAPGGSGGEGRVWQASYAGGGGAATGRAFGGARANGVGRSFAGLGMLDLIAAAEGTGNNYNETLGYGRLTGGKVNLTGMTLDQIDALQSRMLKHPGNKWNSSALGRYQFTRTRLRDLRQRFGLPGSLVFSKALQDALARASLAERGGSLGSVRNEWEGLRKVPDTILRDTMRRHQQQKRQERQTIEGSASLDIRFPNGMPSGTRVAAKSSGGLFRDVKLDTGRAMKLAEA